MLEQLAQNSDSFRQKYNVIFNLKDKTLISKPLCSMKHNKFMSLIEEMIINVP